MATPNTPHSPLPSNLDDVLGTLATWGGNLQRNTGKAFADLRPRDYIRLVIIIGGYCLLRPYLMKLGAWLQMRDHERQNRRAEEEAAQRGGAALSPNALREPRVALPGVDSDDEARDEDEADAANATASNWGRRAKIRQRKMIREKLEEHERRLRDLVETESDQEIAEFLED